MKLLYASAVLTLIALAFMVWSVLAPTPMPVMLAMTVGQGFGTLAFGLYLIVVVRDLRKHRATPAAEPKPAEATAEPPAPASEPAPKADAA